MGTESGQKVGKEGTVGGRHCESAGAPEAEEDHDKGVSDVEGRTRAVVEGRSREAVGREQVKLSLDAIV